MYIPPFSTDDHALDISDVCEVTTLAKPTIHRGIANGTFPPPRKFGRKNIWMRSAIIAWLRNLPTKETGDSKVA